MDTPFHLRWDTKSTKICQKTKPKKLEQSIIFQKLDAVAWQSSMKLQENTVDLLWTPMLVFSSEFCSFFQTMFSKEHLWMAVSEKLG